MSEKEIKKILEENNVLKEENKRLDVTEGRFFRYNKRTVPLLSSLHHRYACQGGSI